MSSAVVGGTSAGAALPGLREEATASREEVTCATHPSSSGCAHSEHKQYPFMTIQVSYPMSSCQKSLIAIT